MDIRNEAEMAIGDTQDVLQAATAWMGSFIATDQRKDKIIQVGHRHTSPLVIPAYRLDGQCVLALFCCLVAWYIQQFPMRAPEAYGWTKHASS